MTMIFNASIRDKNVRSCTRSGARSIWTRPDWSEAPLIMHNVSLVQVTLSLLGGQNISIVKNFHDKHIKVLLLFNE